MQHCLTPEAVLQAIGSPARGLIAVDGFPESGKTTLARYLGANLRRRVVSADDYLARNQGVFFSSLDLVHLKADLVPSDACVFEGVCCLQALQAVHASPLCLVYVKRMEAWGWADEADLESFAKSAGSIWTEVANYHASFRPHQRASIIYERSAA